MQATLQHREANRDHGHSYVFLTGAMLPPSTSLMWSNARWLRLGVSEAVASAGTHNR